MNLALHQVSKRLGGREVLRGLTLEIRDRELFFVLGPSGGGKTTLLRLLAGFLSPDSGEIRFDGQNVNQVPPHRRQAALVFQQPALWPHLTVSDNLGYGLDVRGVRGAERRQRIEEALAIVRLEGLSDRLPSELSGGQQQRVALARALIIKPDVLLLDEPLSNLDPGLRTELREEIRRIHAATQVTMVYVTHDRQDALALADRAAVLNDGRIEQVATPATLFHRPSTRFVADFLGEMNWFPGEVRRQTPDGIEVDSELGLLHSSFPVSSALKKMWVGFRPRHLSRVESALNSFPVILRRRFCAGEHDEWVMETAGGTLVKLHLSGGSEFSPATEKFTVAVDPRDVLVVPRP